MRPLCHQRASISHLSLPTPDSFQEQATSLKPYSRHFIGLLLIKYTEPEAEKKLYQPTLSPILSGTERKKEGSTKSPYS